jgi:hypothetical protein
MRQSIGTPNKRRAWATHFYSSFFVPYNSLSAIREAGIRFQAKREDVDCGDSHTALFTTKMRKAFWLWLLPTCIAALRIGKTALINPLRRGGRRGHLGPGLRR